MRTNFPYSCSEITLSRSEIASRPGRRLRVLVIDEELPWPPNSGKKIRTFGLLKRLARRHEVTLLCYGSDQTAVQALRSENINIETIAQMKSPSAAGFYVALFGNLFSGLPYSVSKHYSKGFQQRLQRLLMANPYDIVQCEWTPYANFLRGRINQPVILATHNIETKIWERRAISSTSAAERIFFRIQERRMEAFERWAFRRFGNVATVSQDEGEIAREWGARKLWVVHNGVDSSYFTPIPGNVEVPGRMLFLGSLDWFPNQEGLLWFINEALPIIRQQEPSAVLRVVGRHAPDRFARQLRSMPNVDFIGEIADVRNELATASVVVVPLRIGGGTRIKILEALAAGRAIASTSVGAEGLRVVDGIHLRLGSSAVHLAQATISLLRRTEDRRMLAAAGRRLVAEEYSWDNSADVLESAWLEIVQGAEIEREL